MVKGQERAVTIEWQSSAFTEMSGKDMYAILKLRQDVFILEQACLYADIDGLDRYCQHIYGRVSGEIKAYLRCIHPEGVRKPTIGRVIVARDVRGYGYGRALMQHGMEYFCGQYPRSEIHLAAQMYLQKFYASLGFVPISGVYLEDGIAHVDMQFTPSC